MKMKLTIFASLLVSSFLIAPAAYMLSDNQPPYEYDAANSYIIPTTTPAGRQMSVHWAFTRVNRVCPGTLTRFVVDEATGYRFSYDPVPVALASEIGDNVLNRTFFLPPGLVPGWKTYYSEMHFACNPLQRIYPLVVRTPRLRFEVTK